MSPADNQPAFPDFPRSDYQSRWLSAQTGMRRRGLDAMLISSEANYRYFGGHLTQLWFSKSRPFLLLLAQQGEPVLILPRHHVAQADATSWVRTVYATDGFAEDTVRAIGQAFVDLGVERGCVGLELGNEQRIGMPWRLVEMIKRAHPETRYDDAADLIWLLRAIKSAREVALIKRSHDIVALAYRDVFGAVVPGMTEREVYRRMAMQLMAHGADRPGHILVTSGEGNYARQAGGPTDRPLQLGDILWIDAGCTVQGYWSDFSRCIAIGKATPIQRDLYRTIRDLTHEALGAAAPGVPLSAMAEVSIVGLRRLGQDRPLGTRVGHGIGLDITEPPSVSKTDSTIAQPGMVLTIEPGTVTRDGIYMLEEVFHVTEHGVDVITPAADRDLPIV
jgi:Xaa-Pro dipeptidase